MGWGGNHSSIGKGTRQIRELICCINRITTLSTRWSLSGLPVLASNKSYVTDVITPSAAFDPYSFQDIANAVRSFDRTPASMAIKLLDARGFLGHTFKK